MLRPLRALVASSRHCDRSRTPAFCATESLARLLSRPIADYSIPNPSRDTKKVLEVRERFFESSRAVFQTVAQRRRLRAIAKMGIDARQREESELHSPRLSSSLSDDRLAIVKTRVPREESPFLPWQELLVSEPRHVNPAELKTTAN